MSQLPALPFSAAWWSFDLGKYRSCDGTYCYYAYDSIPPVGPVSEDLAWLGPLDDATDQMMQVHREYATPGGPFEKIKADAARLGLTLPDSFARLMSSPELQERIPSCTACYFRLSDEIMPCPGVEGGYVMRFLNDQQDVLLWYLYLSTRGEQAVLVSPVPLDELAEAKDETEREQYHEGFRNNTQVCAPTFAEFVYRFWLENTLWFKVSDGDGSGLTEEERRYLAHYQPQP